MRGLVAVIAGTDGRQANASDAAALADAYESLRGPAPRRKVATPPWAQVTVFGESEAEARDEAPAVVGVARGDPTGDVGELEGNFCLVRTTDGTVEAAVDAFGMYPLYRARRNGATYLSTSALALARQLDSKPDRLGLLTFLRIGYQFGARSNWEGISRLDPATRLRFDGTREIEQTYWQPERDPSITALSLEAAARRCTDIAVETCRRLVPEEPELWADLTGGYDTRLATLLLKRAGLSFRTSTSGPPELEDVRLARRVAETVGWDWVNLWLPDNWSEQAPRYVEQALGAADGHLDAVQLAEVLLVHEVKARSRSRLVNGGGGEHFQFFPWQTEFLRAGRSTRVNWDNWVGIGLMRPMDMSVLRSFPDAEVKADLRERMARRVADYAGELNTVQLDLLFAYKMTGHFGAYAAAARYVDVELPLHLRPVFLVPFSSYYRHRFGHRLMRLMIERLDPRVAAVPTTKGGPAQPTRITNAHRFAPYYVRLGRKAINRLTGKALGRPLLMAPPVVLHERVSARATLLERLDLRDSEWRSAPLYEPARLAELIRDSSRPDFGHETLFNRMITVELALRAAQASID
ncbi:MAG TPA: hypothetical protein VEH52_12925 [Gaiellaceae bacterium]|nr:hypothetical protein [Gaiellaceae bacterium]